MHKIVFEISAGEPEQWTGLLHNVEDARDALLQDGVDIHVVAHGRGLAILRNNNAFLKERLERLSRAGIVFDACRNTMRQQNLTENDLFPFARPVDSGVAEVVRRQESGYAYLKAGG